MGELLKNALGYLSGPGFGRSENDFVGQFIEVGSQNLKIKRAIAEGGYAVVYEAVDSSNGKEYALKRLISHDEATSNLILKEISILKRLCGHPHIVQFISAASVGQERSRHVGTEFLIVTEMCHGGQLIDHMQKHNQSFSIDIILKIFYQTCKAVQHLHKQDPPIIHRDLKVENLLISSKGLIKLCDFGSCTSEHHFPDNSWPALKRSLVQDEFEKNTTPMYRAPELLDLYQNYPITVAMDIWALGCILYYLCYNTHPFQDSAKLAILNANYNLPTGDSDYSIFHNLIRQMLLIDPRQRPNINDILGELQELGSNKKVVLTTPIFSKSHPDTSSGGGAAMKSSIAASPHRPPPPRPQQNPSLQTNLDSGNPTDLSSPRTPSSRPSPASQNSNSTVSSVSVGGATTTAAANPAPSGSGMFGLLRGSAGSLMRNIKDASNKVLETVSASMNRTDMDFNYITSRLAVMSFPAESGLESITHNRIEEVQALLDVRHPRAYAVYNISMRPYRADRFDGRLSQRGFEPCQAPTLRDLFEIMLNMLTWLQQCSDNICVVHCIDGKAPSATIICSFLCFCRVFQRPIDPLRLFMMRRCEPSLQPSQLRYIGYVCDMLGPEQQMPHNYPATLINLTIAPVPVFNKMRTGCRPYVEIFRGNKKVYSTLQDYESMRGYTLEDKAIVIPLHGVAICGDVVIHVYHARQSFAAKGKFTKMFKSTISPLKICQVQFHTGFIPLNQTKLLFEKHDLDQVDNSDRYPAKFRLEVDLTMSSQQNNKENPMPWENLQMDKLKPEMLFFDKEEMRITLEEFGRRAPNNNVNDTTTRKVPPIRPAHHPTTASNENVDEIKKDFFTSLEWDNQHRRAELREDDDTQEIYAIPPEQHFSLDNRSRKEEYVADLLGFSIDEEEPPPTTTHKSNSSVPAPLSSSPFGATVASTSTAKTNEFTLLDFNESPPSSAAAYATVSTQPAPVHNSTFDPFAQFLSSDGGGGGGGTLSSHSATTDLNNKISAQNSENLFDLFTSSTAPIENEQQDASSTSIGGNSSPNLLKPSVVLPRNATSAHDLRSAQKSSTTTSSVFGNASLKTDDPFSDLGSLLGDGLKSNNATTPINNRGMRLGDMQPTNNEAANANKQPVMGSGYRFGGGGSHQNLSAAGSSTPGSTNNTSTNNIPPKKTTPDASPSHRPVNNKSDFTIGATTTTTTTQGTSGIRPKVSDAAFGEFLKDSGVGSGAFSSQNQPRTIKEMRREQIVKETDPDKLIVNDWIDGKEKNIRALLCSLNTILWDGVRWKGVNMAELVTVDHVKRQYKNAIRCIHQDKWMGTEYEGLSKLITVELNDAMTEFESEKRAAEGSGQRAY